MILWMQVSLADYLEAFAPNRLSLSLKKRDDLLPYEESLMRGGSICM